MLGSILSDSIHLVVSEEVLDLDVGIVWGDCSKADPRRLGRDAFDSRVFVFLVLRLQPGPPSCSPGVCRRGFGPKTCLRASRLGTFWGRNCV